jgi:hypothetical protein
MPQTKPTQDILYLYCYYSLQQNFVLQEILMALQGCFYLQLPQFYCNKSYQYVSTML